jgi:hypothetical protein
MTKEQYEKNCVENPAGEGYEHVPWEELDQLPGDWDFNINLNGRLYKWGAIKQTLDNSASMIAKDFINHPNQYVFRRRKQNDWKRFEDELPNYGQWVLIFGPQFKRPKVRRWGLDFKLGPHALKYHHWQPFAFTPPPPEKSEVERFVDSKFGHTMQSTILTRAETIDLLNKWEAEKARGK